MALISSTEMSVGNVAVTFFTSTCPHAMPDQVYSIPLTTLPDGLQSLVDSVLEIRPSIPFDFLVKDEYVSTSLEKFLRRRGIHLEEVVVIEYTPAMQAQEGSKMPHDDWVSSIRAPVCSNPSVLLTGAYDHCVRLWSNEECLAIGSKHSEAVKEIALHPIHSTANTSAASGNAKKKRAKDADLPAVRFASSGKDGRICAWEYQPQAQTLSCTGVIHGHIGAVDTVDISPSDGRLVVSGSWDQSVKVYTWDSLVDMETPADKKAPLSSFTDHARSVLAVRFSQSSPNVLYSSGLDGVIKSWDLEAAQLISTTLGDHAIQSISVKPSSGGDVILAGCTDNRIRLYDSRQKSVAKTFSGHRQWCYGIAWMWRREEGATVNENCFASASEDATVRFWDLRCTSSALLSLDTLHTDGVLDVTYVGNMEIASGGKDNKTKTFTLQRSS